MSPGVHGADPAQVYLTLTPEPQFRQVWANKLYTFNVSALTEPGTMDPGMAVEGRPGYTYTGDMKVYLEMVWRAVGGFDFGTSTTGYNTLLDENGFYVELDAPVEGNRSTTLFNFTFTRDAFELGAKPFEDVEITITMTLYPIIESGGKTELGDSILEKGKNLVLIDSMKTRYVEGKFEEMQAEVNEALRLENPVKVDQFLLNELVSEVGGLIEAGDYVEALDEYKKYDEKHRTNLLVQLVDEALLAEDSLQVVEELESSVQSLEDELAYYQGENLQLEEQYMTLTTLFQSKQAELDAAKRSLTSAITVVFLASIVFFFLGRRSAAQVN